MMSDHLLGCDSPTIVPTVPLFEYSELQPDTIRLFELFAGRDEEPISGSLRDTQLCSGHEQYQALSYAWGDGALKATIICNDYALSVTENLYSILCRLRRSDSSLVLWIDGICINQGTESAALQERSQQIALMKLIFSSAFQVVIDLGRTDHDYGYVLTILEQYVLMDQKMTNHVIEGDFVLPGSQMPDIQDFDFWRGLLSLARLPWFHRLWCFQEFVLARDIVTLVGSRLIAHFNLHLGMARAFSRISRVLIEVEGASESLFADMSVEFSKTKRILSLLHRKQNLRDEHQADQTLTLEAVLTTSRSLAVSDMRDQIYAIFALLPPDITSDFAADYNEGISVLQQRFSQHLIQKFHGIWVLVYATGLNEYMPSWTITLSVDDQLFWRIDKFAECSGAINNFKPSSDGTQCCAGGSASLKLEIDSSRSRIMIEGCKFDHVVSISEKFSPTEADDLLKSVGILYQETVDIWTWAEENNVQDDDLWRVLMFDGYGEVRCNPRYMEKTARDHTFTQSYQSLKQFLLSDWEDLALLRAGLRFLSEMNSCMSNMCIAKTAKGNVAAVPYTTVIGDTITVITGVPMPFVLRETGLQYRLVGPCYLQGFMDGEALVRDDWISEPLTII